VAVFLCPLTNDYHSDHHKVAVNGFQLLPNTARKRKVSTISHIYKRGKRDIYYLKYYQDGQVHYKSLRTTSKKRALAIQREIDRRLDAGIIAIPEKGEDADVETFWRKYLQWASDHKAPNTVALEKTFWTQFVGATRIRKLSDATPAKIEAFKRKRLQDGISMRSVNNALKHLQAIYGHAEKLGLYAGPNPFKNVERYTIRTGVPKYLKPEEIVRLLQAAQEDSDEALLIFSLGIYSGMRKAEIDHARREWFDFGAKLITLQSGHGFILKDKDARTIPLSDDLATILEPHRQESGYVVKPDKLPGKYRYRYDIRALFQRVIDRAGLAWVTPHVLRHTFGSRLAEQGVSIYKIQKWMGYSDVRTTQIYAHLQDSYIAHGSPIRAPLTIVSFILIPGHNLPDTIQKRSGLWFQPLPDRRYLISRTMTIGIGSRTAKGGL